MRKILYIIFLLPFISNAQVDLKNSRTKEEAKFFIDSLRNEVLKGGSFESMAALHSEDPGSAKKGGQLAAVTIGQTVPEFESVLFKTKVGDVSEVFETKYGFHFLQVMAKNEEKILARHILISYKK